MCSKSFNSPFFMTRSFPILLTIVLFFCLNNSLNAQQQDMIIRISEIEVHADQLEKYKAILTYEAAASVKLEAGVLAIFPMFQKENPTQVRILEIYADEQAYQSHLKTEHFLYYKTETLKMVKSLKLHDMSIVDQETMQLIFSKLKDKIDSSPQ